MKLVLAEKPSVAMSLSKVIGANQRGDGYMEGNGYLVSWCVGHLVELSQPEAYDEKYAKWRYDDLPILPEHWQYQVSVRWNDFGFPRWRTVLSGKAFRSSDREQNMMPYMRRLYAGSVPTGLSESTPPGFFHVCMGRP